MEHPTPTVSLLLIGSELLDGRILDTNKRYLGTELRNIGIGVSAAITCKDSIAEIVSALDYLSDRSTHIICSGGLGPTTDDLTREGCAAWLGVQLKLNDEVLEDLKALYDRRKRSFDPSNIKQATFPIGSHIISNDVGTAAGFHAVSTSSNGTAVFSLPGVPRELISMFQSYVLPKIVQESPHFVPLQTKGIRVFGLPESQIGSAVAGVAIPKDVQVSFLASFPEVKVTLTAPFDPTPYLNLIAETLGEDYVFSRDMNLTFEEVLHDVLSRSGKTIACAESCTAGYIAQLLTECPGASEYFLGGEVTYSNQAKIERLGVSPQIIEEHGAVSHECVQAMARGVRERFHSSVGISISGIAGPGGGSELKPVGTFFVAIANGKISRSYRFFFGQSRPLIRKFAAYKALDVVRRAFEGLGEPTDFVERTET